MLRTDRPSKDEELRALFDELDSDGSGGLSKQELADVVPLAQLAQKRRGKKEGKSKPLSSAELSKMMKDIEADAEAVITSDGSGRSGSLQRPSMNHVCRSV